MRRIMLRRGILTVMLALMFLFVPVISQAAEADADEIKSESLETGISETGMEEVSGASVTLADDASVTGVQLDQTSFSFKVKGQTVTLTATMTPSTAEDTVTWTSSNEAVVTVDENGCVTAVGEGTANITASVGETKAVCEVSAAFYNGVYRAPEGAPQDDGWYYYKNGVVDTSRTDVIHCTVNGEYAWWYFKNGQVSFTETVAKNSNGWWYIKDGKVDFSYYAFSKNRKAWRYIEVGNWAFK
ncbi:MAG: Ig-like domain-containing protein [Clostridiales bacterium]|nr:Ig-like domain-containing protein [Clostridiales bacterium]